MAITTQQVKELREATGAGVLDCRNALEQSGGDFSKALEQLREKGLATAAKRAGRETLEGIVELYSHGNGRVGVMVEVNCETDFVARSEAFRTFTHEIALQDARYRAMAEGKPENVLDRIVEGRLEKFKDEVCLPRQIYIRDETITVEQLLLQTIAAIGENIVIRRFARWELGESVAQ
jgi:elongation factor Ts